MAEDAADTFQPSSRPDPESALQSMKLPRFVPDDSPVVIIRDEDGERVMTKQNKVLKQVLLLHGWGLGMFLMDKKIAEVITFDFGMNLTSFTLSAIGRTSGAIEFGCQIHYQETRKSK